MTDAAPSIAAPVEGKAAHPPIKRTYIVWSPDGETPPVVPHATHPSAHFAAHQMAKKHPGTRFYVMATTGKAIVHAAEEAVQ